MKTKEEIEEVLNTTNYKELESKLNIKIRNGQTVEGIRKALDWAIN